MSKEQQEQKNQWIGKRHVLATATPEDIDLLLEVRAAVYCRVSDECLDEVQALEDLIRRLSRRRYRRIVGICSPVEPAEAAQEQPTSQAEPTSRPVP